VCATAAAAAAEGINEIDRRLFLRAANGGDCVCTGDSRGQSENQAANPAGNCILQTCSINRAMNGETLASDMQLTR
jgi:hypothetical protein